MKMLEKEVLNFLVVKNKELELLEHFIESKLIVLDEATNALDLKTEKKIIDPVGKFENITILMVAHRRIR